MKMRGKMKTLMSGLIGAATGLILSIGSSSIASGATFDFLAYGNALERGYSSFVKTEDGITVTATGKDGANDAFAYLDMGNAGLGVCKKLTAGNQCTPTSDDNVTSGEILSLSFDQSIRIDSITFKDANHQTVLLDGGSLDFSVNGGVAGPMSLSLADWGLFNGSTGSLFSFAHKDTQFYISSTTVSAVPLPPAVLLFGASLGALGFLGHRRRKAKTNLV